MAAYNHEWLGLKGRLTLVSEPEVDSEYSNWFFWFICLVSNHCGINNFILKSRIIINQSISWISERYNACVRVWNKFYSVRMLVQNKKEMKKMLFYSESIFYFASMSFFKVYFILAMLNSQFIVIFYLFI